MTVPDKQRVALHPDTVLTLPESKVYHLDSYCPALRRADLWHTPRETAYSEATGPHPHHGQRRPCKVCAQ
jgi:hypothetical protein